MNRKKNFFRNSYSGIIKQLVTIVCGFIMTKAILICYGSTINGLVGSITQFLGFIGFLELGIGSVIQSNLYKPLADKNDIEISKIIKASKHFFNTICSSFLIYIVILCFVFPRYINTDYDFLFSVSLIIIISLSSLAQYFWGITYQLLLNADQKSYIQTNIQWLTLLLNTILCIVLMKQGVSIHIVKLVTSIVYIVRPLVLVGYTHRYYKIDKYVLYPRDIIKQKWNGLTQHIAAVICDNSDIAVLTVMSSLNNVSIYMVYYSVVHGVTQIIMTAVNGLEAMWGNMIALEEWETLNKSFDAIEWILHTVVTIIFTITSILVTPFIMVYTKGITDANYYQPEFGVLLVCAYATQCLRVPYFRIIKAAGHYKETQNGAIISAVLNVLISIFLVLKFGLIGVAIGTVIALAYHTLYFAFYLKNHILNREFSCFLKNIVVDAVIMFISFSFSNLFVLNVDTYKSWIILAISISLLVVFVSIVINLVLYKNKILLILQGLK